jgi:hypothetical protein
MIVVVLLFEYVKQHKSMISFQEIIIAVVLRIQTKEAQSMISFQEIRALPPFVLLRKTTQINEKQQ